MSTSDLIMYPALPFMFYLFLAILIFRIAKPPVKRKSKILLFALGFVLLLKFDGLIWGYLNIPPFNVISALAMFACALLLLFFVFLKLFFKKSFWTPMRIVVLIGFLAFQPYFPSTGAFYILGSYLRAKQIDVQAVKQWAREYEFSASDQKKIKEMASWYGPEQPYYHLVLHDVPDSVKKLGWFIQINPENRSVSIHNATHFSDGWGLNIGPDANEANIWSLFGKNRMIFKFAPDAYVWWDGGKDN